MSAPDYAYGPGGPGQHPPPSRQQGPPYISSPGGQGGAPGRGYIPHGQYVARQQTGPRPRFDRGPPGQQPYAPSRRNSYAQGPTGSPPPQQAPYTQGPAQQRRSSSPATNNQNALILAHSEDDESEAVTPYEPPVYPPPQIQARFRPTRLPSHPAPLSVGYDDGYYDHEDYERMRPKVTENRPKQKRKDSKNTNMKNEEKSLGTKLIGGAGGAVVGHEIGGGGVLGTIGGIVAGTLGAAALEKTYDRNKEKRERKKKEKAERKRRARSMGPEYDARDQFGDDEFDDRERRSYREDDARDPRYSREYDARAPRYPREYDDGYRSSGRNRYPDYHTDEEDYSSDEFDQRLPPLRNRANVT